MNTYIITISIVSLVVVLIYFRNKRAKTKVVRIVDENCTGCQRCLKKCRHKALEMVTDETGRRVVTLKYPDKCTACRDCIIVCKFNALELVDRKLKE